MKILVINAGSSSCKYQLFNMDDQSVLCSGVVERIGQPMGKLSHKIAPGTDKEEKIVVERPFPTHVEGMEDVISLLLDSEKGVIQDKSEISAIGHRVLHGGEAITDPVLIDEKVKEIIRDCFPLGPLHNPANLMGIDVAEKLFPGVPNVGVFDTEFGMTLAPEAYLYPLPYSLYEELRIRRYGFHGTSHKYIAKATAAFLGKPLSELNSITMHLGNGSSMSAVQNGKCIDTSMGLTPLEGVLTIYLPAPAPRTAEGWKTLRFVPASVLHPQASSGPPQHWPYALLLLQIQMQFLQTLCTSVYGLLPFPSNSGLPAPEAGSEYPLHWYNSYHASTVRQGDSNRGTVH